MPISNVNNAQNQAFTELVNKPQAAYVNNAPLMAMNGQPEVDSYEGPKQEKKSSFLGKVFKLAVFAGAIIGANRLAHSKGWIKPVEENAEGIVNKYLKKPLNKLDEYVVGKYNKWFNKGATAASEAPNENPAK